jgi:protein Tex
MINGKYIELITRQLSLREKQVKNTVELLDGGATIPFISRYRKEMTGELDEVTIGDISTLYDKLRKISERKETIISTINEQGKLTDKLLQHINECWDSTELEDIYLPYKPKRRTRAEIARKNGLGPLAETILLQRENDLFTCAKRYIRGDIKSVEEALQGARDIIAEQINEDEVCRNQVRTHFRRAAVISSKVIKGKELEAEKYKDYFDFQEPLKKCSSHRLLAIRRGENEGFLRVSISPDDENCIDSLLRMRIKSRGECARQIETAIQDGYKRLLKPSIETEFATESKAQADEEAIRVFSVNLRQLLLAPPLGQHRVMGIDPGFRTGCKVVCLDEQGNLKHFEAIYPHPPKSDYKGAANKITALADTYKIEAIAIGNGTASRETEDFIRSLKWNRDIKAFVVSEDGASVYSASKIARDEFPEYDVTVRGAVSIGRRLMDPLAELVKIDPKSIGVGQYQHDVNQTLLKTSLDHTIESCVNSVGVNLNTASTYLLNYVSGLGPQLAKNIVEYRTEHGLFHSRRELMKVDRMGAKSFEQCAGFLRIADAENPLDNSAVHPESYPIVERMAKDLGCQIIDLITNEPLRKQVQIQNYVSEKIGIPTLTDIMKELEKPGRDPRDTVRTFSFDRNVKEITDLHIGMLLPGIVTNITNFGCFVDIGIHEKGLVHISEMADKFVKDPTSIVALNQAVNVKVIGIDLPRKRISLSLKLNV